MIQITPFIKSFMVNFSPSTDLDILGYRIHGVPVSSLAPGSTDFTPSVSNLLNDGPETTYTIPVSVAGAWLIKLVAYDSFGPDILNYSAPLSVTIASTDPLDQVPPGVPHTLTSSVAIKGTDVFVRAEATINWVMDTIPEDFSNFILRYRKTTGTNDAPWLEKYISDAALRSYLLTPLDIKDLYDVQMLSVDQWNNSSAWSTLLAVDTTNGTAVSAPTGLSFTAALNSVTAVWNASANSAFSNYVVALSTTADFIAGLISSTNTSVPRFTFNGTNSTTYYVRVKTVTYLGTESAWSGTSSIVTYDTLAANKITTGTLAASTQISVGENKILLDGTNSRIAVRNSAGTADTIQLGKLAAGKYGLLVKKSDGTTPVFRVDEDGAVIQNATVGNLVVGSAGILCGTGTSAFKVWEKTTGNMSLYVGSATPLASNSINYDSATGKVSINADIVMSPTSTISWADNIAGKPDLVLSNGTTVLGSNFVYTGTVVANQIVARADLFNLVTTSVFPDSAKRTWSTAYNVENTGPITGSPRPFWLVANVEATIEDTYFAVTPSETLSVASWINTSGTSGWAQFGIFAYTSTDGTGTPLAIGGGCSLAAGQPWTYAKGTITVPLGYKSARAWVQIDLTANFGYARFSDMKISRQGSISADQVNAVGVNAENITGTVLTGKTIQTAASGERFVVSTAKEAVMYDASNTPISKMGAYGFYSYLKVSNSWSYCFEGKNEANFGDGVNITASGYGMVGGYFNCTSTDATYESSALIGQATRGYGVKGSGSAGFYDFYAFGAGTNGPFTGSHDAFISKDSAAVKGDIVSDLVIINKRDISNCISEVSISGTLAVSALGVLTYRRSIGRDTPNAMVGNELELYLLDQAGKELCIVNALGEGQINVCKDGGNIEAGDYICSSNRPGKGMKQDDGLLHNYTVAKARESVAWLEGEGDIRMIACSYHCG